MLLCLFVFEKSRATLVRIFADRTPKGTLLGLPLIVVPFSLSVIALFLILRYVGTIDLSRWSIERFEALGRLAIILTMALGLYENTIVRCRRYIIALSALLGLTSFLVLQQADNWGKIHHHPGAQQSLGHLGLSVILLRRP